MLSESDVRAVLAAALAHGGDWSEVFAENRMTSDVELAGGRIDHVGEQRSVGVGVRVMRGTYQSYAYTNRLTRASLLDAARSAADAMGRHTGARLSRALGRPQPLPRVAWDPADPASSMRRVEVAQAAEAGARLAGRGVRQVKVSLNEVSQHILIANSTGGVANIERTRTRLAVRVLAESGGLVQTALEAPGFPVSCQAFDEVEASAIGHRAAARATRLLNSVPPPPGQMTVVLGAGGGGVLLHEACGHGLEADTVLRRSSVYEHTRGQAVAGSAVTLVDDPSLEGGWASYDTDDECTPSSRTVLLDRGVQVGFLTDRQSAGMLRSQPSGHGRRQSYAHPPQVRMSNLLLLAGDTDPADIVADVNRGIFAAGLSGGEVNTTTGDFVFAVTEGYLIEDGRLTRRIRGASLAGNGPRALRQIDAVGSDFAVREGTCGKDGQWVPVAYGSPTVRLEGLSVGGRA